MLVDIINQFPMVEEDVEVEYVILFIDVRKIVPNK